MSGMEESNNRFTIRIKVTRPFLGARWSQGVKTFDMEEKDGVKYFIPDNSQWRWALKEALGSLNLVPEVDPDYVRLPVSILAPTVRRYSRAWDPKNPTKREDYESFQAGTVITFPVFILSQLEQPVFNGIRIESRPPTKDELINCFKIIGENIGLSPWGSKFGYGRFIVINE